MSQPIAWELVRADYEAGALTLNAICRKYGLTLPRLLERTRAAKWVARSDAAAIDRRILIGQLLGLLELQIEGLEAMMKTTGEKEVAVLNKLAASLEKLIAMDKAEASQKADKVETAEMRDIRDQLAKRIDAITKG